MNGEKRMEIGLSNEVQLSIYLKMDPKNETDRIVSKILQRIIDDKPIDLEGKKELLKYIREANGERILQR